MQDHSIANAFERLGRAIDEQLDCHESSRDRIEARMDDLWSRLDDVDLGSVVDRLAAVESGQDLAGLSCASVLESHEERLDELASDLSEQKDRLDESPSAEDVDHRFDQAESALSDLEDGTRSLIDDANGRLDGIETLAGALSDRLDGIETLAETTSDRLAVVDELVIDETRALHRRIDDWAAEAITVEHVTDLVCTRVREKVDPLRYQTMDFARAKEAVDREQDQKIERLEARVEYLESALARLEALLVGADLQIALRVELVPTPNVSPIHAPTTNGIAH